MNVDLLVAQLAARIEQASVTRVIEGMAVSRDVSRDAMVVRGQAEDEIYEWRQILDNAKRPGRKESDR